MSTRVVQQRTHDELTATYADENQEVDGGIHVDVLEIEAEHAEEIPKGPGVIQVVVDPQRQREHLRRGQSDKIEGREQQANADVHICSLAMMVRSSLGYLVNRNISK